MNPLPFPSQVNICYLQTQDATFKSMGFCKVLCSRKKKTVAEPTRTAGKKKNNMTDYLSA